MTEDRMILAVTGGEVEECAGLGLRLCYMVYRLSGSGALLRSNSAGRIEGGIMSVSGRGELEFDAAELAQTIIGECDVMGFEGVFLDFDDAGLSLQRTALLLAESFSESGRRLYVNRTLAEIAGSYILLPSEVSGGSFPLYLQELKREYGTALALEIVPMAVDFVLPSRGDGTPLSPQRLGELLDSGGMSYYSQQLCAKYFTYKTRDGSTHFVIYDDAYTLREKLEAAEEAGIQDIFLPYAPLREMLPDLMGI